MRVVATIEARMTSSRLPGKVLMPLLKKPALERMIERVKYARYIDEIVVATTVNKTDDPIVELCGRLGVGYYRGSEEDVLNRVLNTARNAKADLICELTGDCPLIDPLIIDQVVTAHCSGSYDHTSNFLNQRTFPVGLDVQVFPTKVLEEVSRLTDDPIDHVHVSYFIYCNPKLFRLNGITANPEVFGPDIRITLDTKEDYKLIQKIYTFLYNESSIFYAKDIVKFIKDNPELMTINRHVRQKTAEEG
ncbi:MAG: glycosyltransferase family protein [candidate division Zixibacteria bacterium]|nr:glycosyltransferase family protein [candidate division Zixibacteria bacterium]